MKDLISIIIPVYNVEKYVGKCLESLINQTYKNLEIILINDGSTDNSGAICDEYAKKDNRIKVIHKENGGVATVRNVGVSSATGEFITFIDSDDTIDLDAYEILYNLIKKHDADMVMFENVKVYMDEFDNIIIPNKDTDVKEEIISVEEALKLMTTNDSVGNFVCTKLFKRELFDGIKFPDGKVYEDAGTTYKVIDKANKIVHTNKKIYNYFYGRLGAITSSFSEKKILDSLDAYSGKYEFISKKYPEIKDYAAIDWIKMYTSAVEKICINDYDEMLNYKEITTRYDSFKEAMDNIDKKLLNQYLEPYRIISATLLRYDKQTYKNISKLIVEKLKNVSK